MIQSPLNKVFVIIGGRREGKSTIAKLICKISRKFDKKKFLIFDINNEYNEFQRSKQFEVKDFLKQASEAKNTIVLFDEATIFVKHSSNSENILNLLVRTAHTGNTIIFCFHAINKVPQFMLELCNYIILLKTLELRQNLIKYESDYPDLIKAFNYLKLDEEMKSKNKFLESIPHPSKQANKKIYFKTILVN
jgi:ABC-type sugar transport system ATPase subunit